MGRSVWGTRSFWSTMPPLPSKDRNIILWLPSRADFPAPFWMYRSRARAFSGLADSVSSSSGRLWNAVEAYPSAEYKKPVP